MDKKKIIFNFLYTLIKIFSSYWLDWIYINEEGRKTKSNNFLNGQELDIGTPGVRDKLN